MRHFYATRMSHLPRGLRRQSLNYAPPLAVESPPTASKFQMGKERSAIEIIFESENASFHFFGF